MYVALSQDFCSYGQTHYGGWDQLSCLTSVVE